MALSCIISDIKRDGQNGDFFLLFRVHSTFPSGGPCRNIAIRFGIEILERCVYQTVKKIENTLACFDRIHESDRRTVTQTDTALRHMYSIARH